MKSFRFSNLLLAFASLAILAGSAVASDSAQVLFQGQSGEEMNLDTVIYRTEYQYRPVPTTCYRREEHVITRCEKLPNGGQRCWQEVVYGPVIPYPCTVMQRIPVQVFDSNVVAKVKLSFGQLPSGVSAHETFVATLDGDTLKVKAKTSGKLLITQSAPALTESRHGDTIYLAADYSFHFYDLAAVVSTFENGIQNMLIKDGKIFFVLDSEFFTRGFRLDMSVTKNRFLASPRVLFAKELGADLLDRTPTQDGRVLYSASLKGLGVPTFEKGKFNFDLLGSFGPAGDTILNSRDIPNRGAIKSHVRLKAAQIGVASEAN